MAKRTKLPVTKLSFDDLSVIGISTPLKDYRLAHFINRDTDLEFLCSDDLQVFNEADETLYPYSFYLHHKADQQTSFYLIGNKREEGMLLPNYKQAAFLVFIKGPMHGLFAETYVAEFKKLYNVQMAFHIELGKIKQLDGIMNDLELHLIDCLASDQIRNPDVQQNTFIQASRPTYSGDTDPRP